MIKLIQLALAAMLVSSFLTGTAPATTVGSQQPSGDGVRRITPTELRTALKQGKAVVVDVRGLGAYQSGHVKGALTIPVTEIAARYTELPKNKLIVTYCSWPAEHSSARAVQILNEKGIKDAAAVLGGYDALVKAGFPIETGN